MVLLVDFLFLYDAKLAALRTASVSETLPLQRCFKLRHVRPARKQDLVCLYPENWPLARPPTTAVVDMWLGSRWT